MANPQKENGYTRIANELMDAFCRYFPGGADGQVLTAVLRKTYGWNKKADFISVSQIMEMTGLSRRTVIYSVQNLEAKKIVEVNRAESINSIKMQKDYEQWIPDAIGSSYAETLKKKRQKYRDSLVQTNNIIVAPVQRNNEIVAHQNTIDAKSVQTNNIIVAPVQRNNEIVACANKAVLLVQTNEKNGRFVAPTKEIKTIQKKVYGEFQNVSLTDDELLKLRERFPDGAAEKKIENLSQYIASHGKKYHSHYATILNWARDDTKKGESHVTIANW